MKLQDVIDNLDRTIAGKELLKKSYENARIGNNDPLSDSVCAVSVGFLDINLDELKKIRADLVLVTCEDLNTRL